MIVITDILRQHVDSNKYVDVNASAAKSLGITDRRLALSVKLLQNEGYAVHYIMVEQTGTDNMTSLKILAPKGTTKQDILENLDKVFKIPASK